MRYEEPVWGSLQLFSENENFEPFMNCSCSSNLHCQFFLSFFFTRRGLQVQPITGPGFCRDEF